MVPAVVAVRKKIRAAKLPFWDENGMKHVHKHVIGISVFGSCSKAGVLKCPALRCSIHHGFDVQHSRIGYSNALFALQRLGDCVLN